MTAPISDSTYGLILLNSFYIGINIENILYGIELVLYFKTIRLLLSNKGAHKRCNVFYALFSTMMLFSITVWVATQAIFGEKMWLLDSDFAGGAYAYWKTNLAVWYMNWSTVQVIVLQLMTDALLIYRCCVIWNRHSVIVVPIILWLATLTLGVLLAWANELPGEDYHTGLSGQFSLAYWTISVFLNMVLTCAICYRVLRHGRRIQKDLGDEFASPYFTVVTTIIESALPCTLSGTAFLVSLGVESPTSATFVCVYLMMMCISPQILILRVMMGRAWDNDTFSRSEGSTVKFSPDSEIASESKWPGGIEPAVLPQRSLKVYLRHDLTRARSSVV